MAAVITITAIAFLLGAVTGAVLLWRALPARLRQHADYRQRWENAVRLLGNQGQLTQEQVSFLLTGNRRAAPEPAARTAPLGNLHDMTSWDRKGGSRPESGGGSRNSPDPPPGARNRGQPGMSVITEGTAS
jgi:hypothetical protein